jgi:hypothetical protein
LAVIRKLRMWVNFRSKITGNLDETEDEAQVSAFGRAMTFRSDKGLNINRGSLF